MSSDPNNTIPALIIAGTGSGVGKTSITLGLVKALAGMGMRVQPFKVGPDYLDPTWLTAAAGRTCYNLDGWMTDRAYVTQKIFQQQCAGADIAIIEGVMGLFDGASPDALTGSTAEIAMWLNVPVLLVVDVGGAARSAAAMVKGFAEFETGVTLAGVIANQCGSSGHAEIVAQALAQAQLPGLTGWLAKKSLPALPDRHLGLHAAHSQANSPEILAELGRVCATQLDLDRVLEIAGYTADNTTENSIAITKKGDVAPAPETHSEPRVRIAVARDAAFYFYYADNLTLLEEAGAELICFSPLSDEKLPANTDAVYIGGGYPEEYVQELAANRSMRAALENFAASGGLVYGECGGLMYLSQSLETVAGDIHTMVGLLPFTSRMLARRKMLGYVESTFEKETWFGPPGRKLRGHEFHYSELMITPDDETQIERIFSLRGRRNQTPRAEGFRNKSGNVMASYVHQHFGSCPDAARAFVAAIHKNNGTVRTQGQTIVDKAIEAKL